MRIVTGSDHAGFSLKQDLIAWLEEQGHEVTDKGTPVAERCDYPDYARPVAEAVVNGDADWGLLVCGTGIGMSMSAVRSSEGSGAGELSGSCGSKPFITLRKIAQSFALRQRGPAWSNVFESG